MVAELDFDRDVVPYIRQWISARAWGRVILLFAGGQIVSVEAPAMMKDIEDLRRHTPRRPHERPAHHADTRAAGERAPPDTS